MATSVPAGCGASSIGTRLWDLAYPAHGFIPLSPDPMTARPEPGRRLRVLVDAYGVDEADRMRLGELLPPRTQAMYDRLAEGEATGTQPWAGLWQQGHGERWGADTAYVAENLGAWRTALVD